jgi:hypothetical protein
MPIEPTAKAKLYTRYPTTRVLIYNSSTILHFLLGGIGLAVGYSFWPLASYAFGLLYLVISFEEMYVIMTMKVCPNCVYYQAKDSLCILGLNLISKKFARAGDPKRFHMRAKGLFCPNDLYLASLILPIVAIIPALAMNFSTVLLIIFLALAWLLLFRFFVIFPKVACLHCMAKYKCPQAEKMGIRNN